LSTFYFLLFLFHPAIKGKVSKTQKRTQDEEKNSQQLSKTSRCFEYSFCETFIFQEVLRLKCKQGHHLGEEYID